MSKGSTVKKRRVRFQPGDIDVLVEPGANLREVALQAGVRLIAACGGAGTCGTCKVKIEEGEVETTRTARVSDKEFEQGLRQACQSRVVSDLLVYVPVESRLETVVLLRERKGLAGSRKGTETLAKGWRFNSPLSKYYLELPPATIDDNVSDLSRLLRGLKQEYKLSNITVDFDVVKKLPSVLRERDWKVTVSSLVTAAQAQVETKRRPRLTNVEAGDTSENHYALAVDIGTTTVKAQLLDLNKGRVVAEGADYNGQVSYGADVITRINYCQKANGLPELQRAVVATINGILARLLKQSRVKRNDVGHLMVAGNTTMLQIFFGIEPKYIRLEPYTPVATFIPPVKAHSLGIEVGEQAYLFAFPMVASYVGGDIVSGVVAAGIHQTEKLTLYIDIGTNGEIVIGNSDWMVTAACSAGPAFEGGEIKHGMLATDEAIEEFNIDLQSLEPTIGTIGNKKPQGICGSGLINIVAGLLEAGVISQKGKFNTDLPSKRIRQGSDGYEFVLAWAPETQIDKDIVITEIDIDNLMRAKAAMYAGYQTLLKGVGLTAEDIEQVIIAGAFGSYLNVPKAITIGLLPDIPRDRFVFIGNGSLMGARLSAFSTDIIDEMRRVADLMTNFELSTNVDFMNNYMAALFLPHTNANEFPSVTGQLAKSRKSERGVTV
ncbi:MAG: ASKHA domain-containing protein [Dehalococcoidales bacterium]|nr:ASKHA domain-containing protein [Dehalococcoidales bacterium]